jgi:hypothetical protein
LPFGIYSVEVWDATGCPADASIYLPVQVGIENVFAQQINIYPNPITDFATVDFHFGEVIRSGLRIFPGRPCNHKQLPVKSPYYKRITCHREFIC